MTILDVLYDAILKIREYQKNCGDMYDDIKDKINPVLVKMEELIMYLTIGSSTKYTEERSKELMEQFKIDLESFETTYDKVLESMSPEQLKRLKNHYG